MRGMKLEARVLFITCIEHHISEIVEAVAETGIDVIDVVAAPYAASFVNLSKTQKMAGSLLANIGSETVSIIVFENGNPISLEVFPIGSNDITNDIALVLKIPLEEAEGIKRGTVMGANIQKKKLDEIIQARLSDIFELIEAHLVKINKSGLLPAGIIITGGGSSIETIGELAKNTLRLPSKIASLTVNEKNKNTIKDASWSVAYGLCVYELTRNDDEIITSRTGGIFKAIMNWAKSISP
jgi:cell division protein FtsA